jgi:hypothetical protein
MFNSRGELVGIVSAKASDAENVNFALPGNYVRGLTGAETVMSLHDLARLYPDPEREPSVDPLADGVAAEVLPGLIAESAFEFESLGESIWGIPYIGGDHLAEVFVSVSAYGDLVLTQAFIVDPPELGAETMRRLLRLNYDRDLVKIGIDGVGDLAVLNETEAELLDAFGLERIADAVATVTDDAAGIVGAGDPTAASGPKLSENLGSLRLRDRNARESMDLLEGVTLSVDQNAWHVRRPLESGTNVWEYVEGDVYFTVIAERLEFPHDVMRDVVVENAMRTAEEARITRYGFREVNGVELMWLEMDARLSGIDFTYFTHVYSGAAGTVQLHAWTSRSLLGEYRETIEEMVAGFEVR